MAPTCRQVWDSGRQERRSNTFCRVSYGRAFDPILGSILGSTVESAVKPIAGLDPHVFPDMDAALEVARKHGIKLTFAIVDFHFFKKGETKGGVQTGGHSDVVRDPAKRTAFVQKA